MGDRMLAPWKKGRDPHPQTARMGPLLNTDDNMFNRFKDEYLQSVSHVSYTKIWKRLIHKIEMKVLMVGLDACRRTTTWARAEA